MMAAESLMNRRSRCHGNGCLNAAPKFHRTWPAFCTGEKNPLGGHLNPIDTLAGTTQVHIFFAERFHGIMYAIYQVCNDILY